MALYQPFALSAVWAFGTAFTATTASTSTPPKTKQTSKKVNVEIKIMKYIVMYCNGRSKGL